MNIRSVVLTLAFLTVSAPARAQLAATASPAERIGGEHAQVVIEEYSDFQCPYCAAHDVQYADSVLAWVRAQHGEVRFDFYDVALSYHADSPTAARAARCAGAQGRYAEARHAIFAGQSNWATSPNAGAAIRALARATVPDSLAFDECMAADPKPVLAILAANLKRGRELGIPGTPTFVIRAGGRSAQIVDPVAPDSIAKVVRGLLAH